MEHGSMFVADCVFNSRRSFNILTAAGAGIIEISSDVSQNIKTNEILADTKTTTFINQTSNAKQDEH